MSERSVVEARRRAYALLGALLVEGVDEPRLRTVRALPPLAHGLPDDASVDELSAEHYALFGHELFPFAGVFVDPSGLVGGGRPVEVVRRAHAALGLSCPDDPSPDHLGQALRLLATLCDAELDAAEHHADADVETLRGWQARVLDEALLPWMPALSGALTGQPCSLWTRVVEMAVGVLAGHRAALTEPSVGPTLPVEPPREPVALLDEPRTGLAKVAELLVTPIRSGVYLARRDLEALARRCELPQGFGGRSGMLERLLRSAAEYGALPRVVRELNGLLDARDEAYARLTQESGLAVHVPPWRHRVAATRRLLARLQDAAQQIAASPTQSDASV
ncbi:MAG: molecular chaperone TorD family protein [Myxococcota bacterium]